MTQFSLQNYSGAPTKTFSVTIHRDRVAPAEQRARPVGHHVIIVDRSGSMYADMTDLKGTLEKVLTLQEFANTEMLVSLFSYSSQGDVRKHIERVPVEEVMNPSRPHIQAIRSLQSTGLTCISQGVRAALSVIRPEEATVVTLHSDGYANDPSSFSELPKLKSMATELRGANVLLNTIAYGSYSDFPLLNQLAALGGGRCIQARSAKEVFTAIQEVSTLLGTGPEKRTYPKKGGALQIAVVPSQKRIVGSYEDLEVNGLMPGDEVYVYTYEDVPNPVGKASSLPYNTEDQDPVLAFMAYALNTGNLNAAKGALLATADPRLVPFHLKALTGLQLKNFASDLEGVLFDEDRVEYTPWTRPSSSTSLLDLLSVWEDHRSHVLVNMEAVKGSYKSLGVKRVAGVRADDGTITEPKEEAILRDEKWMPVYKFVFSREEANINWTFEYPITLRMKDSGAKLNKVAGIDLTGLTTYRNFSVVHNGEVYIPEVAIRFTTKDAYRAFKALGILTDHEDFDPDYIFNLSLEGLPLASPTATFDLEPTVFDRMLMAKVIEGFCSAALKEDSASYTADQIKALKEFNLTSGLNYSPPTTNAYTDLRAELDAGRIDSRPIFQVSLGTTEVLNLGKLNSGNKHLKDYFTGGEDLTEVLEDGKTFERKGWSPRKKITASDRIQSAIFDEFLGIAPKGIVAAFIEQQLGLPNVKFNLSMPREDKIEALTKINRAAKRYLDSAYRREVGPLAYTVAVTGMIPDGIDAEALNGEEMGKRFPDLSISKKEKEGMFFLLDDGLVLTVFEDQEYFTPRG